MRSVLPLPLSIASLAACAHTPAAVDPTRARLALDPIVIAADAPAVRSSCKDSILGALRRHGFVVGNEGTPVAIEVSFWPAPGLPEGDISSGGTLLSSGKMEPAPPRSSYTADLTATIRTDKGPRTALGTGTGYAGASACSAAAERLADSMVEATGKP